MLTASMESGVFGDQGPIMVFLWIVSLVWLSQGFTFTTYKRASERGMFSCKKKAAWTKITKTEGLSERIFRKSYH